MCVVVFIGATRRNRPATRRWRRHSGRTRQRSSWTGRAPLRWRSSNSSRPITYRFENRFLLEEQTAHHPSFRWTIQWPSSHRTRSRASPSSRPSSFSKIQKRSDFFFRNLPFFSNCSLFNRPWCLPHLGKFIASVRNLKKKYKIKLLWKNYSNFMLSGRLSRIAGAAREVDREEEGGTGLRVRAEHLH